MVPAEANALKFEDLTTGSGSIQRALEAIRTHLGMEVAYISEFVGDKSVFRAVDAPGLEAAIKTGDEKSLDDVFCRHILAGRLPELIPDVSANPFAMSCPIMQEVPIGAHMSVPIRLEDGETYGMFCCLSFEANPSLNDRDLKMMRVFADMAAHQINRDVEADRLKADKRARIQDAIDKSAFSIVYQPIVDFSSMRPIGFESLCRFSAEPYRSPDKWFNEAAEVGLGVDLEIAAIEKALIGARALPADIYVSINASPELVSGGFLPPILRQHVGRKILVEVTEHAIVADYDLLRSALDDLRAAGADIAVDDAGAGYSGLQHIIQVRPEAIKLDISLTRDIDADPARRALIAALIFFARETGCLIIAEGIETEKERLILHALGVTKGQGYLLGKPMPLAAALESLAPRQARSA